MRRRTRAVKAGPLIIGGGFPVSVQTMWKTALDPREVPRAVEELGRLAAAGCDLVRFAVPDAQAAETLGALARLSPLPLAADIHFDHALALRCMDFPIAKVRINPGNIGEEWKVRDVVAKAKDTGVSLRVGVNAGSLPRSLEGEASEATAMVKAAEIEMEVLDRLGFRDVVFSLKSSEPASTIEANRAFSALHDFPLHVGVTEAGPLVGGIVKSTLGIGTLLSEGIGDTVRVSLSAPCQAEVDAGLEILKAVHLRESGVNVISCPHCGRSSFDVEHFVDDVSDFIRRVRKPLTIAVMGCVVNGPGEARKADIGITGAGRMAIIFKGGEVLRRVAYEDAAAAFREEVEKLL